MTGKLLSEFKQKISEFKLIPGSGGAFEITFNGELVYSKLQSGEFPDENAIQSLLEKRLKK